jgi:hypothetical protein
MALQPYARPATLPLKMKKFSSFLALEGKRGEVNLNNGWAG